MNGSASPSTTGAPLISAWQDIHGPVRLGHRLAPKIPFVLGGEFTLDNLYEAESIALLRFRTDLYCQIRDLPDGTTVQFDFN